MAMGSYGPPHPPTWLGMIFTALFLALGAWGLYYAFFVVGF